MHAYTHRTLRTDANYALQCLSFFAMFCDCKLHYRGLLLLDGSRHFCMQLGSRASFQVCCLGQSLEWFERLASVGQVPRKHRFLWPCSGPALGLCGRHSCQLERPWLRSSASLLSLDLINRLVGVVPCKGIVHLKATSTYSPARANATF